MHGNRSSSATALVNTMSKKLSEPSMFRFQLLELLQKRWILVATIWEFP